MKSILDFVRFKNEDRKITMLTCYDFTTAQIVQDSEIDCILVGDSGLMTMHGHKDTLSATSEILALHVAAVRRGAPTKFIVADMPFLAHRGSLDRTLESVRTLMSAGANAVKIEGVDGSEETLAHVVQSGVPVMGHLGLTPQSIHSFGGFKVQATEAEAARHLFEQAKKVQAAGAFALVLECVPSDVAREVTTSLKIPTIGIGAGAFTSGQVLVLQDMLGLNPKFRPKFLRQYLNGAELFQKAFNQFSADVKSGEFPSEKESY